MTERVTTAYILCNAIRRRKEKKKKKKTAQNLSVKFTSSLNNEKWSKKGYWTFPPPPPQPPRMYKIKFAESYFATLDGYRVYLPRRLAEHDPSCRT